MPGAQVDVDASIGTLLMRNRTSCNPLAYSIRPDTENLCRLWHRVPLRPWLVLSRHALHHAPIMPAVLGILPPPTPFAPLRSEPHVAIMRTCPLRSSPRRHAGTGTA